MQMKQMKLSLSRILCIVLIVAMALFTTGCNGREDGENPGTEGSSTETSDTGEAGSPEEEGTSEAEGDTAETENGDGITVLGEGATEFLFTVVDKDGTETRFEIHTDKTVVGEALQALDLIEGEEGDYGLYVKTVNGITADYDKDGVYWAFYINDEYAMSGVDATDITAGASYSFKVEK